MNILFLADNFPPEKNAQASRVYERACYWVRWGHRVTVITCAPNFPEGAVYPGYRNRWHQVEEMSGIRVVRVKTYIAENKGTLKRSLDYLSFLVPAAVAALREERPDVIVATTPHLFTPAAGWVAAAFRGVPFVMEVSDLWPDSIVAVGAMKPSLPLRLLERLELFLYGRAAHIVVLTPAFLENLARRGVPREKVSVVINGVDLEKFEPRPKDAAVQVELGIAPHEMVVAYMGTLGMAHDLRNVLDAAEILQNRGGSRTRFLLVGPGAERNDLVAEAARRGLRNVTLVPAQAKERMPALWSVADVALVHLKDTPLFATVIPSKMFEAMAMGLPILLVAPAGEASTILLEEDAGIWVPAGDPPALAEATRSFESQSALRARLGAHSLAAAPRYSRERQARDMAACLEIAHRPRTATAAASRPRSSAVS